MPTASPTSVPAPPEGAASAPTVAPEATSAGQRPVDIITVDAPKANAVVSSPLTISGSTNFWPFEASLAATLKDAAGNTLAIMPVMVQSPGPGTGGPFSEKMTFTAPARAQDGTLEVFEASAKDGSITSIARVKVRLVPAPAPGTTLQFDQPDEGALVSFPLHVAFGGARGDEKLTLRVVQAGAPPIAAEVQAQLGFVVATIPGNPAPGPATLEVARADGAVLARRALRIAAPAETQTVKVAWVGKDGQIALEERRVPRTQAIGAAALNELLWGPDPGGDTWGTSLPTPAEVLSFSGRAGSWGPRVRLLKLTIVNGVALANFSPELRAYGGGAARVAAIRQQIETTLRQFPSVKRVVIAVDGQTEGVLEP
jgi:spore germination protein GerM